MSTLIIWLGASWQCFDVFVFWHRLIGYRYSWILRDIGEARISLGIRDICWDGYFINDVSSGSLRSLQLGWIWVQYEPMRRLFLDESWWLGYIRGAFLFPTLGLFDNLSFERYFPLLFSNVLCFMLYFLMHMDLELWFASSRGFIWGMLTCLSPYTLWYYLLMLSLEDVIGIIPLVLEWFWFDLPLVWNAYILVMVDVDSFILFGVLCGISYLSYLII